MRMQSRLRVQRQSSTVVRGAGKTGPITDGGGDGEDRALRADWVAGHDGSPWYSLDVAANGASY
jgi:hypothetical protein